jgi:single-stranded-DNA-specific exonuclease
MVEEHTESEPNSLIRQVVGKRGIREADLTLGMGSLPDEALLANIGLVAERIEKAMYDNEPTVIFGHDDPDGVTSAYILYHFFNSCGYQKHNYYIPNRNVEPHGIQQGFVDFVRDGGYKLVVTVDNGISSYEGVEKLNRLGCETIITDHHLIQPEHLPRAYAHLNPQLPDCKYPYKSLAGVGVALMLIRYLGHALEHPVSLSSYFWTAVGSIADKVPMTGVNRMIVRHVIENWHSIEDPSVEFLLRNYNRIETDMDVFNFILYTSRLIANGREPDGQHTAMRFLLQVGDAKAELFQSMEAQKKKWEGELNHIFGFLDTVSAGFNGKGFIYFDDDDVIPYPLLGTAATYILGRLGIPTIMLKQHNEDIVCEGRCGEGFNMVEAFSFCKENLKQFGGHVKAAGFTLEPSRYDNFLECYNGYLNENLPETVPSINEEPDAILGMDDFTGPNWRGMELLLPFGQQNQEPRILVPDTSLERLQQRFQFEHGSLAVPVGKTGDVLLLWRAPRTVKILSFREGGSQD